MSMAVMMVTMTLYYGWFDVFYLKGASVIFAIMLNSIVFIFLIFGLMTTMLLLDAFILIFVKVKMVVVVMMMMMMMLLMTILLRARTIIRNRIRNFSIFIVVKISIVVYNLVLLPSIFFFKLFLRGFIIGIK